jgi:hypothetical protein
MRKLLFVMLLLVAGCATPSAWVPAEQIYSVESQNYSVELPQGWMRFSKDGYLLLTRDGVLLQNILIERSPIDTELKHTKRKFSKGMLPQEQSEVILDNISSDQAYAHFETLENIPVKIAGLPGFKAVFEYKTMDGLRRKSIYYGFMAGEWFYSIRYTAAQRYYFDKDIKTFEKVLESFRLIKTM